MIFLSESSEWSGLFRMRVWRMLLKCRKCARDTGKSPESFVEGLEQCSLICASLLGKIQHFQPQSKRTLVTLCNMFLSGYSSNKSQINTEVINRCCCDALDADEFLQEHRCKSSSMILICPGLLQTSGIHFTICV